MLSMATFTNFWVLLLLLLPYISPSAAGDMDVIYFTQKVDHFHSYVGTLNMTFQQKILLDNTRWGGAKVPVSPIFAFLGGEMEEIHPPNQFGILNLAAKEFHGMLIYIQHRFYGESIPLGSMKAAMANHQVRACLTTDQALEDFAVIIQSLRFNLSAFDSPVIVVGGGYSGALAAWFRLKYNEIAVGALASSTPMLLYANVTATPGFCTIVSRDFEDVDPKCHQLISQSWSKIDQIAAQPDGLKQLSQTFNTCRPIKSTEEVKMRLAQFYSFSAIRVGPENFKINAICNKVIVEEDFGLQGVADALRAEFDEANCFDADFLQVESPFEPTSPYTVTWAWQRCTELVFPIGCEKNKMLPSKPFHLQDFERACSLRFGIKPKVHSPISVFGTQDIIRSLKFGGNIIFSNGLRDPFSSAGILEDISETIVAIKTTQGSQRLDLLPIDISDPKWLEEQRQKELKIFRGWIADFHHSDAIEGAASTYFLLLLSLELIILLL